jgi:hypothetical protein
MIPSVKQGPSVVICWFYEQELTIYVSFSTGWFPGQHVRIRVLSGGMGL